MCDLCETFGEEAVKRWEREAEELILHPHYPTALSLMKRMTACIAANNAAIEDLQRQGLHLMAEEWYESGQQLMEKCEKEVKDAYGEMLALMAYLHAANEHYPLEGREALSNKMHMEWFALIVDGDAERAFKSHRITHMLNLGADVPYKPFEDVPQNA